MKFGVFFGTCRYLPFLVKSAGWRVNYWASVLLDPVGIPLATMDILFDMQTSGSTNARKAIISAPRATGPVARLVKDFRRAMPPRLCFGGFT